MFNQMSPIFILLAMIALHIHDDFVTQPVILNKLKQKDWWKEQFIKAYEHDTAIKMIEKYKFDYLMALLMHSISWTFMVMLPIALKMSFNVSSLFGIVFLLNTIIHFVIDDLKANRGKLNLIQDQIIHILQIILTFIIFKI